MWAGLSDASCQEEGRKEHEEHEEHEDKGPCANDDSERQWWLLGILALGIRFVDATWVCDVGEFNCFILEICVSSPL